jgi:transcription antitermination factor NusG
VYFLAETMNWGGFGDVSWSLAVTAPNREFAIARALSRWDFENFVPKICRRIAYRGTIRDRLSPAFPSYIFCRARNAWEILRSAFGIIEFVRQDGRIAILPDQIVNSLLAATDANGVLPTPPIASPRFNFGDRVIIRGMGILAGQSASFQHAIDVDRCIVDVDWMGRMVPVAVDECDLISEIKATNLASPRKRRRRHRPPKRHRRADV